MNKINFHVVLSVVLIAGTFLPHSAMANLPIPIATPVPIKISNTSDLCSIPNITCPKTLSALGAQSLQISPSSAPLGSFEEQALLGLTDFLVDRAKEEGRLYIQDELTHEICDDIKPNKGNDNKKYFPNTCNVLDQLKNTSFPLSSATVLLRSSIKEDLRDYPDVYLASNFDPSNEATLKYLYGRIAYGIFKKSRSSRDVTEIIGGIASLEISKCAGNDENGLNGCVEFDKIKKTAIVIWNLSENLRQIRNAIKQVNGNYDLNRKAIFEYVSATVCKLNDSNGRDLIADCPSSVRDKLKNALGLIEVIQDYRTKIEEQENNDKPNQQADLDYRLRAALTGIAVMSDVATIFELKNPNDLKIVNNLAQAVITDNYSEIIMQAKLIAQSNLGKSDQYLPLLVELASAKSSDDVRHVLEMAAAPAGSYREKFNSDKLTSITAFAGVSYTKETFGANGTGSSSGLQPFLPVGLHQTWKDGYGARGIFVSVIDLGTLAMSRQANGVESNSNVGWGQVFSPGFYFTQNFSDTPFVIGIGWARTPKLANTDAGTPTSSNRIQVFVSLDLTLMAFR